MQKNYLSEKSASSQPASDIFVVNGTAGNLHGLDKMLALMGQHGLRFYKSRTASHDKGPGGLIAAGDTIVIKVNSQWDQRGGPNTDLLKALIRIIVEHPDGFAGEIVVADNGQDQYGSAGKGGNLDWSQNNAVDTTQSVQKVVDSFKNHRVSTYLWDTITNTQVKEYGQGDQTDGYVVMPKPAPGNGFLVSYPKFKTKHGAFISLKKGVWNPETEKYDSRSLKIINLPTFKAHFIYGVTGCVKHYMGVVSDKLTAKLGARSHDLVGAGGMGTEIAGVRYPALNILDATWVNAKPAGGPWTPFDAATWGDVIMAGTDPVAIDYWAAKNVLMPLAREAGHKELASIDPDNTADKTFGKWLRLAMGELNKAGFQTTVDEKRMNIFVVEA
ncbi:MAG TPA: DUF362 domain-containing protein [Dehalococcoidales bacterium]